MLYRRTLWAGLLLVGVLSISTAPLNAETALPVSATVDQATQEKCLQVLRAGLQSDEFWPSMHAAEALTRAGFQAEVLEALKDRLDQEEDLRHRCGLAREQFRAGDQSKLAELQAVLANSDPYGHVHACESLYKVSAVGDVKLLQAAMADESEPAKALMAAAALARSGDKAGLKFIRTALTQQDSKNLWIAAWLLGSLGDAQDVPALKASLAYVQLPLYRAYIENGLGLLGDAAGQKTLIQNLKNEEEAVRADAAYMVGDAGLTATIPQLKTLLEDPILDVRVRAAEGLLTLRGDNEIAAATADGKPEAPAVTLTLAPGPGNSRNSEGDFIQTKDGRILFIYSHFGESGSDHGFAELREKVSVDGGLTWSEGRTIVKPASGLNVMSVSLLRLASGDIALFNCAKVSLSDCRPELRISTDEGKTWGPPVQCITDLVDYYVLNNDRAVQLKSGRLLLPVCLHRTIDEKKNDWQGELMCYISDDQGKTWRRSKDTFKGHDAAGKRVTAQEPGVVELKDGRVMMFIRSSTGTQMLSYSEDGGDTWSDPVISKIKSPISPASIERLPATGDLLMVWNDHSQISPELRGKRTPFSVAISKDDGKTWGTAQTLYDDPFGWYCYTAIDFVGDHVLLGHCAGDRRTSGLGTTKVTRLNLDWLYQAEQ